MAAAYFRTLLFTWIRFAKRKLVRRHLFRQMGTHGVLSCPDFFMAILLAGTALLSLGYTVACIALRIWC